MEQRPLLFIDVDGPLNPYDGSNRGAYKRGYRKWKLNGFNVLLNAAHGPALSALPYDLVWGTTWETDANLYIAPRVGLPRLPVCGFPSGDDDAPRTVYFKTPDIIEYAFGRPFAWIDDEVTDADREWVAKRHNAPALLHWVDPAIGLEASDFEALAVWADELDKVAA
ncbi:hypothetical protein ACF07Q_00585 [Nocardiopsis dassonvillei]|uniref:hypothetical protein n=1 Tax=Nocardiopsis dassonvillei TaxID=2014 RepID=UPI003700EB97